MPLGSGGHRGMVVPRIRERGPLALAEPPAAATRYAEGVLKSGWIEAAPLVPGWWFLSACRVSLLLPYDDAHGTAEDMRRWPP
jgi:hypothetical protein